MLDFTMQPHVEPNEADNTNAAKAQGGACCGGIGWRFPLLLVAVLVAIVVINGRGVRESMKVRGTDQGAPIAASQPPTPAAMDRSPPLTETVSLVVDFGGGRRSEWNSLPWREGLTVDAVLSHVAASGELSFTQQGSGSSTFLSEMNDVANEGAGGKNWIYHVNAERADRSFAVYELRPGDQVLWRYGESR
jgi:hypothetical protein